MTAAVRDLVAADGATIARAAEIIRHGGLVAFATETVYGLGADATNDRAVARIFAAKDRPEFNPLIVHIADHDQADGLVVFDDRALRLARRFWPGPLSLVLPRAAKCPVSLLASAGLDTLAVRAPRHATAQALIAAARCPIAAPSANRSGEVSPTTAQHVLESLGDAVDLILDSGPCPVGIESTVVDLSVVPPLVLRPGGLATEELVDALGEIGSGDSGPVRAPGMLASHYAPRLKLRLAARDAGPDEALLAFGPVPPTTAAKTLNLSATGDVVEAAANLFAMLRALDESDLVGIAVMAIPEHGLGRAINDRLRRAAAPRSLAGRTPLG